jgi:hypothetical protein
MKEIIEILIWVFVIGSTTFCFYLAFDKDRSDWFAEHQEEFLKWLSKKYKF